MDWSTAVPLLAGTALLALQGRSFLASAERGPSFHTLGWMTLLGAGLILLVSLSLATGVLVLSPELNVALAQGRQGIAALAFVLLGSAVWAGLGLHATRVARGRPARLLWALLGAAAIGLLSMWRIRLLDSDAPRALAVRAYDMWWPPLLVWIGFCALDSVLGLCRVTARKARTFATLALVVALSIWALERAAAQFRYADSWSLTMWRWILAIAFPAFAWVGSQLSVNPYRNGRRLSRWLPIAAGLAALAGGVTWAAGWATVSPALLWLVWLVIGVGFLTRQVQRRRQDGPLRIPDLGAPGRLDDVAMLIATVGMALALVDLLCAGWFSPELDLAVLILAWVILLELLGGAPLGWVPREKTPPASASALSPLAMGWTVVKHRASQLGGAVKGWLLRLVKVDSWPVAVVKTLAGLLILIALSDIPNAGKTIIYPFTTLTGTARPELGPLIADRVRNMVGLLGDELQAHVPIPTPGKDSGELRLVASSEGAVGLETALGKSSDLEFGGVKVPLGLLLAPVQTPVRRLLGIREIHGAYQSDDGRYVLFASASDGSSWRVEDAAAPADASVRPAPGAPAADATVNVAGDLADQLAFRILAHDPAMAHLGMTRSWNAFQQFRKGRAAFQEYEAGDADALSRAIENFRAAIHQDGGFVLAHYWLGLAWRVDGQPSRAVEAFSTALRSRSDFVPGYVALANTLSGFTRYYSSPAALGSAASSEKEARDARVRQAVSLWYQVLQAPADVLSLENRATAYFGLCDAALNSGENNLAYFYCRRAVAVLDAMPAAQRDRPEVRDTMGNATNNIAVALERTSSQWRRIPITDETEWDCSGYTVSASGVPAVTVSRYDSPYKTAAFRYYDRARALLPTNTVIRCNAAKNRLAHGDAEAMKELAHDAAPHAALGDSLSDLAQAWADADDARRASAYYRLALYEYQTAIAYAPTDVTALNSYAYRFWEWRLRHALEKPPQGPDPAIAHQAEAYARLAVRMAAQGGDRSLEAAVRDTLGEVLLAQGRPHEAIEVFQGIETLKLLPQSRSHDEIRWDMAQAYMCAAWVDEQIYSIHQQAGDYRARASTLLKQIEQNEKYREELSYTGQPERLDQARTLRVCMWGPDTGVEAEPDSARQRFVLHGQPDYEAVSATCNWLGVAADARPDGPEGPVRVEGLQLHAWGGGVDAWVGAGRGPDGTGQSLRLDSQVRDSHHYYFVQLTDDQKRPVSPVYPIRTASDCSRNLISLSFEPGPASN